MPVYVMNQRIKRRIESQNGELKCKFCGKPIKVGDKVVSLHRTKGKSKFYHADCYEKLFSK